MLLHPMNVISNFDNIAETFRCTYCNTEVEEDASALPKRDARTLLAKFNEQIEPIFALLRETEDIVLPYDLLEPQPTEIPGLSERYKHNSLSPTQNKTTQQLLCCKIFEIPYLQATLTLLSSVATVRDYKLLELSMAF